MCVCGVHVTERGRGSGREGGRRREGDSGKRNHHGY